MRKLHTHLCLLFLLFSGNAAGQDTVNFSTALPTDSIRIKSSIAAKVKPKPVDLSFINSGTKEDYSAPTAYVPGGFGSNGNERNLTADNLENIDDLRKENQRARVKAQAKAYTDYAIQLGYVLSGIVGIFVIINFILKRSNRTRS